jgi:hypothetical protein
MNVYQTSYLSKDGGPYVRNEHPTSDAAATEVEANGFGTVIQFSVNPNMPHCEPAMVYSSCAMWQFANDEWTQYTIFSGDCDVMNHARPGTPRRDLRLEADEICGIIAGGKPHMIKLVESKEAPRATPAWDVLMRFPGQRAGRRVATIVILDPSKELFA